jgi:hypothetical protein
MENFKKKSKKIISKNFHFFFPIFFGNRDCTSNLGSACENLGGLNCFSFNLFDPGRFKLSFFVFIYSIYGVNEDKKGQFEPARCRVRKLNEKQFRPAGLAVKGIRTNSTKRLSQIIIYLSFLNNSKGGLLGKNR